MSYSSSSVPESPDISEEEYARMMSEMREFTYQPVRVANNYKNTPSNHSSSPDYIVIADLIPSELGLYTTFESMGLRDELLDRIYQFGIKKPTTLQQKGIMPIINGMDVLAQVHSGSGKTGTFVIGLLQSVDTSLNETQVLVLTPSKESAIDVQEAVLGLGHDMNVQCHACTDGISSEEDLRQLQYGQHVVSGTPDVISEMIKNGVLKTQPIKMVIIDGLDIMVFDGCSKQVYDVFSYLPKAKQVVIFTETRPSELIIMEVKFLRNHINIVMRPDDPGVDDVLWNSEASSEEEPQEFEFDMLRYTWNREQVVVFCENKERVVSLAQTMQEATVAVSFIHGDMTQKERDDAMKEYKLGTSRVLVSTFDCERDVKVDQQPVVVNFEVPSNHDGFMLRYGRPARFGPHGVSVEFVDEGSILPDDGSDELIFEFDDL